MWRYGPTYFTSYMGVLTETPSNVGQHHFNIGQFGIFIMLILEIWRKTFMIIAR
jgi:hypothetical protein